MPYDIYGQPLRSGYCEVHPDIHEEYPCSECSADQYNAEMERQYEDYMARQYEEYLKEQVDA